MSASGLPAVAAPLAPPAGAPYDTRVRKAARDFEAVLLASLLRSLEEAFSAVPGEDAGAGADDYHYLGTQALASALATSGGLGIARLVVSRLAGTKGSADTRQPSPPGPLAGR